jgi:hypothetical protein
MQYGWLPIDLKSDIMFEFIDCFVREILLFRKRYFIFRKHRNNGHVTQTCRQEDGIDKPVQGNSSVR